MLMVGLIGILILGWGSWHKGPRRSSPPPCVGINSAGAVVTPLRAALHTMATRPTEHIKTTTTATTTTKTANSLSNWNSAVSSTRKHDHRSLNIAKHRSTESTESRISVVKSSVTTSTNHRARSASVPAREMCAFARLYKCTYSRVNVYRITGS